MQKYVSWEELDEVGTEPAPEGPTLPVNDERIAALMAERAKLERRMLELLGKAEPSPDQERDALRFPMPIHTAESRLEDRRIAREQERAAAAARRALERARIRAREEREREQAKREHERARLAAEAARRAEQQRRAERQQESAREQLAREVILRRWAELRSSALRNRERSHYRDFAVFELRNERNRERALLKLLERRAAERAIAERLDRRLEARDEKIRRARLERPAMPRKAEGAPRKASRVAARKLEERRVTRRRRDFDFEV